VRLHANHGLILRVVEEFVERLESVGADIEAGLFLLEPGGQVFHGTPVLEVEAMIFEHVAQRRQKIFGLESGPLGLDGALRSMMYRPPVR
jgi:hypothetical protein